MSGYLHNLRKPTGSIEIDAILQLVANAGDSFHHTENWDDDYYSDDAGRTWVERIHEAACRAAKYIPPAGTRGYASPPTERPAATCLSGFDCAEPNSGDDHIDSSGFHYPDHHCCCGLTYREHLPRVKR